MTTISDISNPEFAHILAKTRAAADLGRPGPLSTGEALIAALILNRTDWLIALEFTIPEALERIGPEWARLIPAAAKQVRHEIDFAELQKSHAAHEARLAAFRKSDARAKAVLDFNAKLVTTGNAPGYRDVRLTFDLRASGDSSAAPTRVQLRVSPADGEALVHEITEVHRFAWRSQRGPIDAKADEQRPRWIEGPA
jgi:hypothetical protein